MTIVGDQLDGPSESRLYIGIDEDDESSSQSSILIRFLRSMAALFSPIWTSVF